MKRILLIAICFTCISLSIRSQNVANTFWLGYDTTNTPDLYWHFTSDSLYFSLDNVNWTIVSTFTENAALLNITDVPTPPPYCGGTGNYSKSFNGDTMWLTLVNDTCSSRVDYITTHYFVNTLTGISEANANSTFRIFPNPTTGVFTITATVDVNEIVITDVTGRVIELQKNSTMSFDLTNSPPGIYFVTVMFENSTSTQKISVE